MCSRTPALWATLRVVCLASTTAGSAHFCRGDTRGKPGPRHGLVPDFLHRTLQRKTPGNSRSFVAVLRVQAALHATGSVLIETRSGFGATGPGFIETSPGFSATGSVLVETGSAFIEIVPRPRRNGVRDDRNAKEPNRQAVRFHRNEAGLNRHTVGEDR